MIGTWKFSEQAAHMQHSSVSSKPASHSKALLTGRGTTDLLDPVAARETVTSPRASLSGVGNSYRGATLVHIPKKAKVGCLRSNESGSSSSGDSSCSSSYNYKSGDSSSSRNHNSSAFRSVDPRRRKSSSISISIGSRVDQDSSCDPGNGNNTKINAVDALKISAPWHLSAVAPMAEVAKVDDSAHSKDIEKKEEIHKPGKPKLAHSDQRRQRKQRIDKGVGAFANDAASGHTTPTWIGVVQWPSKTHLFGALQQPRVHRETTGESSLLGPFNTALAAALAHDYAALTIQATSRISEAHGTSLVDAQASSTLSSAPTASTLNFPDLGLCAQCRAFTVPEGSFLALDADQDVVAAAELPECGLISKSAKNKDIRRDSTTLLCDGCDAESHFTCSGLQTLPEASHKWFCSKCSKTKVARKNAKQKGNLAQTEALEAVATTAPARTAAMVASAKLIDVTSHHLSSPPTPSISLPEVAVKDNEKSLLPMPMKTTAKAPTIVRPVPRQEDWILPHELPPQRRTYYGAHSASSGVLLDTSTNNEIMPTSTLEASARTHYDVGKRVSTVEQQPDTQSSISASEEGTVLATLTTSEDNRSETTTISYRVAFNHGNVENVAYEDLERVLDLETADEVNLSRRSMAASVEVAPPPRAVEVMSVERGKIDQRVGACFERFALQEQAKLPKHWPRVTQLRAVHRAWAQLSTAGQAAWSIADVPRL